ncbi:MAG: hypothetical protein IJD40_06065 [Lachnospiraceae bacterium]|nr:hypothetical protein [Lachnospiraceae bacterium]
MKRTIVASILLAISLMTTGCIWYAGRGNYINEEEMYEDESHDNVSNDKKIL